MAIHRQAGILVNFYEKLFGINAIGVTAMTLPDVRLLDASLNELATASVAGANWQAFGQATDCAGDSNGIGVTGVQNSNAIDFGNATATWPVKYISVYSNTGATGSEVFRIELESTITYATGEGVVIAAGGLKLGSEYII